jgi:hypothetical protein
MGGDMSAEPKPDAKIEDLHVLLKIEVDRSELDATLTALREATTPRIEYVHVHHHCRCPICWFFRLFKK